jgi:hypothetical protein
MEAFDAGNYQYSIGVAALLSNDAGDTSFAHSRDDVVPGIIARA